MYKLKVEQLTVGPVACNCYIAMHKDTHEAFIVDPGAEPEKIKKRVEKMGAKPINIFLTHGHFDHAGAAAELADYYNVPIIAHMDEKETLEDPYYNLSGMMGGEPQKYFADEYVRDNQVIPCAGFPIETIHIPGHTKGGCCYYLMEECVVFTGDTLFCESIGRSDFPGGSGRELLLGICDRLMVLPLQTEVFPGHGERSTIQYERENNPFF